MGRVYPNPKTRRVLAHFSKPEPTRTRRFQEFLYPKVPEPEIIEKYQTRQDPNPKSKPHRDNLNFECTKVSLAFKFKYMKNLKFQMMIKQSTMKEEFKAIIDKSSSFTAKRASEADAAESSVRQKMSIISTKAPLP